MHMTEEPETGPGRFVQFVVVWLALAGLGIVLLLAGVHRFENPEVSCVPPEPEGTCTQVSLSPGGLYEREVTLKEQVIGAKFGAILCFIVPGAAILAGVLLPLFFLLWSMWEWITDRLARSRQK
jgi:hypothetical protein